MSDNDISSYQQLDAYFFQNMLSLLDTLNSKYIVESEAFLYGVTLPNNTPVLVRRTGGLDALAAVGFFFPHKRQRKTFGF
jgi:hexosaminidase